MREGLTEATPEGWGNVRQAAALVARPCTLEPMPWAWLTGTPVLLVGFIGIVLGIPASLIAIAPVVRRALSRRAKKRARPASVHGAHGGIT
jgi:hypothetical protein